MHFNEIKDTLIEMLTTWQVIAVSIVVILYFFLVSSVARGFRRVRLPLAVKKAERKKAVQAKPEAVSEDAGEDTVITEE